MSATQKITGEIFRFHAEQAIFVSRPALHHCRFSKKKHTCSRALFIGRCLSFGSRFARAKQHCAVLACDIQKRSACLERELALSNRRQRAMLLEGKLQRLLSQREQHKEDLVRWRLLKAKNQPVRCVTGQIK